MDDDFKFQKTLDKITDMDNRIKHIKAAADRSKSNSNNPKVDNARKVAKELKSGKSFDIKNPLT